MNHHRTPTDTLILTGIEDSLVENPEPLVKFLSQYDLEIELVSLSKFGRILLLCENAKDAKFIYSELKTRTLPSACKELGITFSMKDNGAHSKIATQEKMDYLELPSEHESRRFLISPPLSPPGEWDHWGKVEDGPSKITIPSPQELSHLLWERLGGFQGEQVIKYTQEPQDGSQETYNIVKQPEVLFKNIDNGVPAIVLDPVQGKDCTRFAKASTCKTAMPPPLED